jgi:hypothetical protein
MDTQRNNHGGYRDGAGRKKSPSSRRPTSFTLTRDVFSYLQTLTTSRSDLVDGLIRESIAFKQWASTQSKPHDL